MKEILLNASKMLNLLDKQELAAALASVADAIAKAKIRKVEDVRTALSRRSRTDLGRDGKQDLGAITDLLGALCEIISICGAKKKIAEDTKTLLEILREHRHVSLDEFCLALDPKTIGERAVDHQLVNAYLDRLQKALGDEQKFPEVYEALAADKRVAQPEAVALASEFLAPIAKSTSRPKALRQVLYRHQKLLESRAASASIAARR
jgi:hypothetical protein